jgi:hypothetical protein
MPDMRAMTIQPVSKRIAIGVVACSALSVVSVQGPGAAMAKPAAHRAVRLAQAPAKKPKPAKRRLKTIGKQKGCPLEKQLKDSKPEFPAFINRLAAVKTVERREIRGRSRWVVTVGMAANRVRRLFAKKQREAAKNEDSAAYYRAALKATNYFIDLYSDGIRELREHGIVEKRKRVVGGGYYTTMWESWNAVNAWRLELETRLVDLRERRRAKFRAPAKLAFGCIREWLLNANGSIFLMRVTLTQGGDIKGQIYRLAGIEPVWTRTVGFAFGTTIKFDRINERTKSWKTQTYSGRVVPTKRGFKLTGTFTHKGVGGYKWCAVASLLVPPGKREKWRNCAVADKPYYQPRSAGKR